MRSPLLVIRKTRSATRRRTRLAWTDDERQNARNLFVHGLDRRIDVS